MLQLILFILISLSIGTAILWFYKGGKSEEIKSALKEIFQSIKQVFSASKKLFLLIQEIAQNNSLEESTENKNLSEEINLIDDETPKEDNKESDVGKNISDEVITEPKNESIQNSDTEISIEPIQDKSIENDEGKEGIDF
tara:strand:+ start:527 stop:946 length:420 start_codon:yes stop_codon:yes gene_type:complete